MRLVTELRGGSLSQTAVYADKSKFWVRKKISINKNREYGLVRWQSQLRKLQTLTNHLPDNTIPLIGSGVEKDHYFFDIEYIENSDNLIDALRKGLPPKLVVSEVTKILKKLSVISYPQVEGSLSVYVNEELKRPIELALDANRHNALNLSNSEKELFNSNLKLAIEFVENTLERLKFVRVHESLTHGNFTLENAIWDYNDKTVKLIDPYAETYCETILGDVSQLLQSSSSGYEVISEYFNEGFNDILNYPYEIIPEYLTEFSFLLKEALKQEVWYDSFLLDVLHASQFSRMLPFKLVNNPRSGVMFLNHAVQLIRQIK